MSGGRVEAVATAKFKHDGEWLRPGSPFECSDSELADLRVLGFAQRAPTKPAPVIVTRAEQAAAYQTSVLVADAPAEDRATARDDAGAPLPKAPRYRRRDMQASK